MSEIEMFEVQCGECELVFQIDATQAGTNVHCPHCQSEAEIPSLEQIRGEKQPDTAASPSLSSPAGEPSGGAAKTDRQPKQPLRKKQQRTAEPAAKGAANSPAPRGKIKTTTARNSAKLLLKVSGMLYYVACFVGIAWSIKFVGMLYPIVNSKRGSYLDWFIEATITTGWAAALIGLLIAVAELIIVIIHIQENINTPED
jgi:hypothetical protein